LADISKETVAYNIPEMDDVEIGKDVVYYRENNNVLHFDIYYPKADESLIDFQSNVQVQERRSPMGEQVQQQRGYEEEE
jgi:hypothetical protein